MFWVLAGALLSAAVCMLMRGRDSRRETRMEQRLREMRAVLDRILQEVRK